MFEDKARDPDDLGEPPNGERLRRMKEIMERINNSEVPVRDLKIPPVRSKHFIIGASIGSVLLLVSSVLYKYNWFVSANEDVLSAKGAIDNALQQRSNLFSNLVNLTLNQATMEQETMRFVAEIRARQGHPEGDLPNPSQTALSKVPTVPEMGSSLPEAMARLFAVSEQYPDIKTSATYKELMDKLMDLETHIHTRRDQYNEKVRTFNAMTVTFPWRLVAYASGFERYQYFQSDPHRPDTMEINIDSGTFRRLIPKPRDAKDLVETKPVAEVKEVKTEVKPEKNKPATTEPKP
ncbi:putative magnetosome protein MamQ [Gammaproteobacteria bacterium]